MVVATYNRKLTLRWSGQTRAASVVDELLPLNYTVRLLEVAGWNGTSNPYLKHLLP